MGKVENEGMPVVRLDRQLKYQGNILTGKYLSNLKDRTIRRKGQIISEVLSTTQKWWENWKYTVLSMATYLQE